DGQLEPAASVRYDAGHRPWEDRRERAGRRAMKRLVLESTAPFQGLPELVAYDEGLFEKEGLDIEWVDRDAGAEKKKTVMVVTSPAGRARLSLHAPLFEQGGAHM